MLGGRTTAKAAGLDIPNRDEIYSRICALPPGALFSADDILQGDHHLTSDFAALRGYDYVHVANGLHVGIIETDYLRLLPKIDDLIRAFCSKRDCAVVDTGDRIAWRVQIKQWEPILGHRYYSESADEVLSFGRMAIRIINAPAWLRDESDTGRLFRVFHDTPEKEFDEAVKRARKISQYSEATLFAVAAHARALEPLSQSDRETWDWATCPHDVAARIEISLRRLQEERSR